MGGAKVWLDYDQDALDFQYDQRKLVPHANDYMVRNLSQSEHVRAEMNCQLDVAYGPSEDEILDIFPSAEAKAPGVIYVHGGAWTRWHKGHNSYQARSFVAAGATFVSVNFALVPKVTLDELIRQNQAAVAWVYDHANDFGVDQNRLFIAGHSSGAHVVGLLAVTDWNADWNLPKDAVKGCIAASGMYDLTPVQLSSRNQYLKLDEAAVARNSALRQLPDMLPPFIIAYGGREQEEFQRQSRDFAIKLRQRGHTCEEIFYPEHNHFDVAQEFDNPEGALLTAAFKMMGVKSPKEEK